ncbi:MAG: pirin family protein [Acidobacteriota bacterium]
MKTVRNILSPPSRHWVGDGFHVASVVTPDRHQSPFILLDYGAPTLFAPSDEPRGVGPHPHRGFETVTIVYQGEVSHRDSAGNSGTVGPGDVQWMTAASGVLHEELHSPAFTRTGGTFEVAQIWVNLPARHKMSAPKYQSLVRPRIPVVPLPGSAGTVRVIGGSFGGVGGAASTFTRVNVWDLALSAGERVVLPIAAGDNAAVFVRRGDPRIGGHVVSRHHLAELTPQGVDVEVVANGATEAIVLSGEPIDEPLVAYGPFVMNTHAEIRRAIDDFQSGRMGQLEPSQHAVPQAG